MTTNCAACGFHTHIRSRGLCDACYEYMRRLGRLAEFPRKERPRQILDMAAYQHAYYLAHKEELRAYYRERYQRMKAAA